MSQGIKNMPCPCSQHGDYSALGGAARAKPKPKVRAKAKVAAQGKTKAKAKGKAPLAKPGKL